MTARRAKRTSTAPLPTRFAGPGQSPGFLLWRISNAWQRRQRAALQPLGLTHSQFVVLAVAVWFGGSEKLTQARLAELCGIDPMSTSQIVRALQAAGLLERREHDEDSRAKTVEVTTAGREKARAASAVVEKTDEEFFAPVGASTERLVKIFKLLAQ